MMGWGQGGGPGYGWKAPLSEEQANKMNELREKHWEETRQLKRNLFSKRQELWRHYSQEKPDPEVIGKLEKELFDMGSQLREKRFAFRQEARKIAPEAWAGGWGGPKGGRGWRGHHMGGGWSGCGTGHGWGGHGRGPGWGHMGGGHGGCPRCGY
jgi:hypothetical protein